MSRWLLAIPFALAAGAAFAWKKTRLPALVANLGSKGTKAMQTVMPSDDPMRQRIVDIAQGAVGLNGSSSAKALGEFLGGPGETDIMKASMATSDKSSTCELFARAVYREAGFKLPALSAPYAISSGIEPLTDDAKAKGAWVEPSSAVAGGALVEFPKPGDIITGDYPTATAHVRILHSFDPSTMRYTSFDGGATDAKGHQEIVQRDGVWKIENGVIKDYPSVGNVHKVTGWVDAGKYAEAEGLVA